MIYDPHHEIGLEQKALHRRKVAQKQKNPVNNIPNIMLSPERKEFQKSIGKKWNYGREASWRAHVVSAFAFIHFFSKFVHPFTWIYFWRYRSNIVWDAMIQFHSVGFNTTMLSETQTYLDRDVDILAMKIASPDIFDRRTRIMSKESTWFFDSNSNFPLILWGLIIFLFFENPNCVLILWGHIIKQWRP